MKLRIISSIKGGRGVKYETISYTSHTEALMIAKDALKVVDLIDSNNKIICRFTPKGVVKC